MKTSGHRPPSPADSAHRTAAPDVQSAGGDRLGKQQEGDHVPLQSASPAKSDARRGDAAHSDGAGSHRARSDAPNPPPFDGRSIDTVDVNFRSSSPSSSQIQRSPLRVSLGNSVVVTDASGSAGARPLSQRTVAELNQRRAQALDLHPAATERAQTRESPPIHQTATSRTSRPNINIPDRANVAIRGIELKEGQILCPNATISGANYAKHARKKAMPPKTTIHEIARSPASVHCPAYIYKFANKNNPGESDQITSFPGEIVRHDKAQMIMVVMRSNGTIKTGFYVDLDKPGRTPETCYQTFLKKISKDGGSKP